MPTDQDHEEPLRCRNCRKAIKYVEAWSNENGGSLCTLCYDNKVAHKGILASATKETFESGAQRDQRQGKGRFDLISPEFEKRIAIRLEQGASHYGERNWEAGIPIGRSLDSAKRHINQYMAGDRSEDHLAAAAVNIMFVMHTVNEVVEGRLPKSLDDNHYVREP